MATGVNVTLDETANCRTTLPRRTGTRLLLKPEQAKPKKGRPTAQPSTVVDDIETESLLANLSENLASANAMISDLAFKLEGSRRHVAMGIQQVIEVSELLANRALDIADPR